MSLDASVNNAGGSLLPGSAFETLAVNIRKSGANTRFNWMFKSLKDKPWIPADHADPSVHTEIDALSEALFVDSNSEGPPRFNGRMSAGYTYLGQFITHDISFDPRIGAQLTRTPANQVENERSPAFDLDSIYDGGPSESKPGVYVEETGGIKRRFAIERNTQGELDLRRDLTGPVQTADPVFENRGQAIIPDLRNDENIIISQLHLAFQRLHNRFIDEGMACTFEEARQLTRWHYQWVVVHDFLPKFCGPELDRVLATGIANPTLEKSDLKIEDPVFMPVELAVGALRAGHSMARPDYELNDHLTHIDQSSGSPFELLGTSNWPSHLTGGRELPRNWSVQWDRFFPWPSTETEPQLSKAMGPRLVRPLRKIPLKMEEVQRLKKLSTRTLERSWRIGVPSGPEVAHAVTNAPPRYDVEPLWLYVLHEAWQEGNRGQHLGPVGGTIVAEAMAWIMAKTPDTYFRSCPNWKPLIEPAGEELTIADLLHFSCAPMTNADWEKRNSGFELA